jgi:DNA-binding transcriptional ArsR family regulator
MTQRNLILTYLRSKTPAWVPSYDLEKARTEWGWLGTSGGRRARELAEAGLVERKIDGKYSYYRALPHKRIEVITDQETGKVFERVAVYGKGA